MVVIRNRGFRYDRGEEGKSRGGKRGKGKEKGEERGKGRSIILSCEFRYEELGEGGGEGKVGR